MVDFSINKTKVSQNSSKRADVYSRIKARYEQKISEYSKSDFANSTIIIQKKIELLKQLREMAIGANLDTEVKELEERLTALNNELNEKTSDNEVPFSNYVTYIDGISPDYKSIDSQSKENDEKNKERIIKAFSNNEECAHNIEFLINNCKDTKGIIIPQKVEVVEMLAASGVHPAFMSQILEEMFQPSENIEQVKNTPDISYENNSEICNSIKEFKNLGFDDINSFKFAKFLSNNFEDKELIKSSICKMNQAEISADSIIKILDALSIVQQLPASEQAQETNVSSVSSAKKISAASVKSIINFKKTLSLTRNNETQERNNPINKLGVKRFELGDSNYMIMKGNKVSYVSPAEGETLKDVRQEYKNAVSDIEDKLLYTLASKYKQENGEINSKVIRLLTNLRKKGITYESLFKTVDSCISANGAFDESRVNAIKDLKEAGALSRDLDKIISSFEVLEDGTYDVKDIKNACDLTAAVIGGEEVKALVCEIKEHENVKDFIINFSKVFEDKSHLLDLLPLIKDKTGNFDENAMGILEGFANNFFDTDKEVNENDFIEFANKILQTSINSDEIFISDDSAGICAILCKKKVSPDDIINGLEICKNSTGKTDEKLAQLLWNMTIQDVSFSDIKSMILKCKDENSNINYNTVDILLKLLEQGYNEKDILNFVKTLT